MYEFPSLEIHKAVISKLIASKSSCSHSWGGHCARCRFCYLKLCSSESSNEPKEIYLLYLQNQLIYFAEILIKKIKSYVQCAEKTLGLETVGVKNHACSTDMLGYFFQFFFFCVCEKNTQPCSSDFFGIFFSKIKKKKNWKNIPLKYDEHTRFFFSFFFSLKKKHMS